MRRAAKQDSASQPHTDATPAKSQFRRVHLGLLYGLSLGLILLLIVSVSQTLQERLSTLQATQQIQAWKDYAKALKVTPHPTPKRAAKPEPDAEHACTADCESDSNSDVLNVESPEKNTPGPRYHF